LEGNRKGENRVEESILEGNSKGNGRVGESTSTELVTFEGNSKGEGGSEALLLELTLGNVFGEPILFCHLSAIYVIGSGHTFTSYFPATTSYTHTYIGIHLA